MVEGHVFHRTLPQTRAIEQMPVLGEIGLMRLLAARLDELITETGPDLIHAHSPVLTCLPALWIGRKRRIPVVYEIRAFWEDAAVGNGTSREGTFRYRSTRNLERFAAARTNAVVVICDGLRRDLVERGIDPDRITVVPNGVDLEAFGAPEPPDPDLLRRLGLVGKTVLGYFGSLYPYEGLDLLLESLVSMREAARDLRVLIAGGGPELDRLRKRANTLGLEGPAMFLGPIDHGQMRQYYALADIMIYPRLPMRLTDLVTPLKPIEAMAQGKIVIASDVGGHRELIGDGQTGYLFRAGHKDALRTCLADVVFKHRADWPRIRANARRYVAQERTWRAAANNYRRAYAVALRDGGHHLRRAVE
jgi:PEP-CTERM/exosortase A-associated glycosyltransferase